MKNAWEDIIRIQNINIYLACERKKCETRISKKNIKKFYVYK